ncbi:class I SAM-dependent methyltransferase [Mycolicibacterium sediminis]|uniref:SAM-dependent methyltransferase n=1 Tax=Mycolicibacterium sediminis TaxID=1286180 RepID=A0A7I7QRM2_9MYCO|nr:class I SAM-dependent methyltransferase [Mycolicibacterium sediminis]BBY28690.1 SAM-dependent methyltransferase [Mycolicibacterium sediminis]
MPDPTVWAGGRYESVAQRISGIAVETVERAGRRVPLDGASVVDLACGTGSAALAAAARGARVTGVDLTPELLAQGRDAAEAAQLSVTWVTADAADTGLPEAAFDVAVSNMGIIFVEPERLLAETVRVLAPGATFAFSAWVRNDENPLFDPIVAVLGAPPPRDFTPDQWGDRATASRRLAAHFDDVEVEDGSLAWRFDSMDDALRFLTDESPMHVDVFRRLEDARRDELIDAFRVALLPHSVGGAVSFDAPYVVVSATLRE